jgi:stearoyl-CoA desaturase (delta-9 desaturase)
MSVLTLGSGWHNNHHAFPRAAILQFHWWQLDPSGFVIALLERVGLAWNVRRVDAGALAARRTPRADSRVEGA